jgi:BirA family transcriptional regulator, biotin operon repressor / biotin---[acetyl-CoA-carboxylase] ligase
VTAPVGVEGGATAGGTHFDVARFRELRAERQRQTGGPSWGEALTYLEQTGSSNDDALAAARAGASSGSVFLAEHQTHGRGRRGRTWLAEAGQSLLFSVLFRPAPEDISASGAGGAALTLAVGLGVRAALAPYSREPLLVKWPNDILCGRRKLAGILCESQLAGSHVAAIVIGIGINVGRQSFPPELAGEITCLSERHAGPGELQRELLLVALLAELEQRVLQHEREGISGLLEEFRHHDALRDQRVSVSGQRELTGVARGVDAQGQLLLETDGVLLAINAGTVRLR